MLYDGLMSSSRGALVITGSSRGIGAATARLAASRGYAVCINYARQRQAAEQLVSEILASGGVASACQADVSKPGDVLALFEHCDRELGALVGLVNNAGILETQTRAEHIDLGRLERVFAVNVFGAFLCSEQARKQMSTRLGGKGGVIVNVSSMASRLGSPNEYIDYAAAKGAVDTFTVGLAKELAEEGIRVNAVRPGLISTEMHASGGEPARVERLKHTVPLQRGGTALEVAHAILWLLSEEASFVTGTFLDVSGGR
jgi:NAD(P)-dependent dehydrogenase (short-subunit alcohol dehydrogenase family)